MQGKDRGRTGERQGKAYTYIIVSSLLEIQESLFATPCVVPHCAFASGTSKKKVKQYAGRSSRFAVCAVNAPPKLDFGHFF